MSELNSQPIDPELCTFATCTLDTTPFNYRPSPAANIVFAVIFGLCVVVAAGVGWRYKTYTYTFLLVVGCMVELLGYVGRTLAHENPWNFDHFIMQIVTLTFAPVFLAAAIYLCITRIVIVYGQQYSRLKPVTYVYLFVAADIVSLVLQSGGGAMAATADAGSSSLRTGTNIMIAGLLAQVVTLCIFIGLCTDFFIRMRKGRKAGETESSGLIQRKIFLSSLGLATFLILLRSGYRVAELWEGWDGELISHEPTFIGMEGVNVAVACILLAVINPGWGFRDGHVWRFGADFKKTNAVEKAESGGYSS